MSTLWQDLRYGARSLAANPGFTATATLSLGLGILAATAMYSVIHGVVIDPFPYKDVDNLVSIAIRNPEQRGWRGGYSVDEYAEIAHRATIFEGAAASTISDVLWIWQGEPVRLRGNHISHNGFDVMGVPAMLGRTVTAAEEQPETKAVLGYRFWVRQFGANPDVIGTTLALNGRPRTIVGVMPPRFMFRGADVYLPILYRAGDTPEGVTGVHVTARRKAGITAARAAADLNPILGDLAARFPGRYPPQWRVELITFKESFPSGIRGVLWVLFGAVGLLLLIACVNVSSLLLARASTRQREIAMRAALGAGRWRLFRQLLTESVLIGLAGGALGVAGSWLGLKAIMAVVPAGVIPDESEVTLNVPVLAFSLALCLGAALVFGLAPAIHAASGDLAQPLRESGRGTGGSRRMGWLRATLVLVELSLAVVLLSGAGVLLHSLLELHGNARAAGIAGRLTLRLPLNPQRYSNAEKRSVFTAQLLERVAALPGVHAVGINAGLHPLGSWQLPVEVAASRTPDKRPVNLHQVNTGYLQATAIQLRGGRWLEEADVTARRHVVVVNETFQRRYFGDEPVLGKTVAMPRLKTPPFALPDVRFEIVGVTGDALFDLASGEPQPEMFIPYSLTGAADILVVHTAGDPMRMAPAVRAQVYALDAAQFVDDVSSLETLMDRYVYSHGRFRLWLMGVFAALGLALAVVGVYGLLAQVVSLGAQEYGVRMAVGAHGSDIVRLVLARGLRLMAAGVATGVAATVVLLRRFGEQLGAASAVDPVPLAAACALLLAAGLAASAIPAWRAARTDPVQVLR